MVVPLNLRRRFWPARGDLLIGPSVALASLSRAPVRRGSEGRGPETLPLNLMKIKIARTGTFGRHRLNVFRGLQATGLVIQLDP
jgi:hypothetical protein